MDTQIKNFHAPGAFRENTSGLFYVSYLRGEATYPSNISMSEAKQAVIKSLTDAGVKSSYGKGSVEGTHNIGVQHTNSDDMLHHFSVNLVWVDEIDTDGKSKEDLSWDNYEHHNLDNFIEQIDILGYSIEEVNFEIVEDHTLAKIGILPSSVSPKQYALAENKAYLSLKLPANFSLRPLNEDALNYYVSKCTATAKAPSSMPVKKAKQDIAQLIIDIAKSSFDISCFISNLAIQHVDTDDNNHKFNITFNLSVDSDNSMSPSENPQEVIYIFMGSLEKVGIEVEFDGAYPETAIPGADTLNVYKPEVTEKDLHDVSDIKDNMNSSKLDILKYTLKELKNNRTVLPYVALKDEQREKLTLASESNPVELLNIAVEIEYKTSDEIWQFISLKLDLTVKTEYAEATPSSPEEAEKILATEDFTVKIDKIVHAEMSFEKDPDSEKTIAVNNITDSAILDLLNDSLSNVIARELNV
jgi:hypothetical protein